MKFDYRKCWKIPAPKSIDQFIQSLTAFVPPNSILFISGAPPNRDLEDILAKHSIPWYHRKPFLPTGYHVKIVEKLMRNIGPLIEAAGVTPIEIDVYHEKEFLIRWFDVMMPESLIYISKNVPKAMIDEFCERLQGSASEGSN